MNKPKYLIFYTTIDWKLEFIKKRLINYKLIENTEEEFIFENFDVIFIHEDNKENARGLIVFGIIIEDSASINNDEIQKYLVPMISNPFIGGVHVMK